MQHSHDKVTSDVDPATPHGRRTLIQHRALILAMFALPCLMLAYGLIVDPLTGPTESGIPFLAPFAFLLFVVLFNLTLFKGNPLLRKASQWTFRSYRHSVMGLDEREKLVVDQAFRTSYRILALTCALLVVCLFSNLYYLHLAYRLGTVGSAYILFGAACLLQYLPATIVAWQERG